MSVTERTIWALTGFTVAGIAALWGAYHLGERSGGRMGVASVVYADSVLLRAQGVAAITDSVLRELHAVSPKPPPRPVSTRRRDSLRIVRWTSP